MASGFYWDKKEKKSKGPPLTDEYIHPTFSTTPTLPFADIQIQLFQPSGPDWRPYLGIPRPSELYMWGRKRDASLEFKEAFLLALDGLLTLMPDAHGHTKRPMSQMDSGFLPCETQE